jgi:hypothetical protein
MRDVEACRDVTKTAGGDFTTKQAPPAGTSALGPPAGAMEVEAATPLVNNPWNDRPKLLRPTLPPPNEPA